VKSDARSPARPVVWAHTDAVKKRPNVSKKKRFILV